MVFWFIYIGWCVWYFGCYIWQVAFGIKVCMGQEQVIVRVIEPAAPNPEPSYQYFSVPYNVFLFAVLGSAWPFGPMDLSVRRARYKKVFYLQRALTLQRGRKRPQNASGHSIITFLVCLHPKTQFIFGFLQKFW